MVNLNTGQPNSWGRAPENPGDDYYDLPPLALYAPQAGPPTPSLQPTLRVCRSRQRLPGAPEGTIHRFPGWSAPASSVFPDTTRDWAVYVPAQHDGTTPASLLVALDGAGFLNEEEGGLYRTPTVADNLIHSGAIPPTVIVFVNPGQHAEYTEQRSREYDTVRRHDHRTNHHLRIPAAI